MLLTPVRAAAVGAAFCLCAGAAGQQPTSRPTPSVDCYVIGQRRYGCIDRTGKIVVRPIYKVLFNFEEGRALFGRFESGLYGFLDPTGREVIPSRFLSSSHFSDGLAVVEVNSTGRSRELGVIDKDGRWVLRPGRRGLAYIGDFHEGLAQATAEPIERGTKFGFINRHGAWVISPRFNWAEDFSEGVAAVDIAGKRGFIDHQGRVVISAAFTEIDSFAGGLARVHLGTKRIAFIDHAGRVVIEPRVDDASPFRDQWSVINSDGKYGYMDKSGSFPIAPQYDAAAPFSEGFAAVLVGDRWGFIDRRGRHVIPPTFEVTHGGAPGPFRGGLARVYWRVSNGAGDASPMAGLDYGYIDGQGAFVWPPGGR